jgi:sialic acid synthase SpsE
MTKIIAELCQNHNGNIKLLEEMVHAASEAGASYCKIQSMKSSELVYRDRFEFGKLENGKIITIKRPYKNELERLSKLDLTDDDHFLFIELCNKYKIKPTTTIFTRSRLKFLKKLNLDLIKIASFDCASHTMIEEVCKTDIPYIIISTGTTYDHEIEKTVNILKNYKKKYTLLHCISIYPTPACEANLNRIDFLKTMSDSVGFSDHSNTDENGINISIASMLFDVDVIERHFTILPKEKTKDGVVSINFNELKTLVEFTKKKKSEIKDYLTKNSTNYMKFFGKEKRVLSEVELLNRDYYRGRFASKNKDNLIVNNWEDKSLD